MEENFLDEEEEIIEFEDALLEKSPSKKWALPSLYRTNLDGKDLYWQVGFDGKELWMKHGKVGSEKIQRNTREIELNSSGRSLEKQALQEAIHRYQKKYRDGYFPEQGKISINKPMLANDYNSKSIKHWPVAIQAKLDGVRALIKYENDETEMFSRSGKKWTILEHICEEAKKLFEYLPPGSLLDGEVYDTKISFDALSGTMRTTKGDRSNDKNFKYHIFDLVSHSPFEVRYACLEKAFSKFTFEYLYLMPVYLASNEEEIKNAHDEWVSQGYEGLIIRRVSFAEPKLDLCLYKPKRCQNLIKYKTFKEEEVTIIDVTSSKGTEKGLAIPIVRDDRGNIFKVRPQGNFETRKQWFDNPSLIINKRYTIKYYEKTPKGIPRFPVGKAIRDYE